MPSNFKPKTLGILFFAVIMALAIRYAVRSTSDTYGWRAGYDQVSDFDNGLAKVRKGNLYGFVNSDGEEIIPAQYAYLSYFGNYGESGMHKNKALAQQDTAWYWLDIEHNKEPAALSSKQYNWMYLYPWLGVPSEGLRTAKRIGSYKFFPLYGYVDSTGMEVIRCQYELAAPFHEGAAVVMDDGKYGFIDRQGKPITDIKYNLVAGGFYNGRAQVFIKNQGWGYINKTGETIIPTQYEKISHFFNGRATVKKDGKWGAIDTLNNVIIPTQYDNIDPFVNTVSVVRKGDYYGLIDTSGRVIMPCNLDYAVSDVGIPDLFAVKKAGKWGFVNSKGKMVVDFRYKTFYNFYDGVAGVTRDGLYTFITPDGKELFAPRGYDEIHYFYEARLAFRKGKLWGFIDKTGKEICAAKYDFINDFENGRAIVQKNNLVGYINPDGVEVIPLQYFNAYTFSSDVTAVSSTDENYFFINQDGKRMSSDTYTPCSRFAAGLAFVNNTKAIRADGSTAFLFPYLDALGYSENVAAVKQSYWGYIDTQGKIVLPFVYDDAIDFSHGVAAVKKGNYWACIDKKGKLLYPFVFDKAAWKEAGKLEVVYHGVEYTLYF